MRFLLLPLLLLAAGAGAWFLLREPPAPPILFPEDLAAREAPANAPPVAAVRTVPKPAAIAPWTPGETLPPDDGSNWMEKTLSLPVGSGTVTGKDILAGVKAANVLLVRAPSGADLEALEAHRFEDVPRDQKFEHAALEGILRNAGFDAIVANRVLIVRRRPAPPPEEGDSATPR